MCAKVNSWRADWVSEKRAIALKLESGGCGGSYGEAMLILCAAVSALAAEVWPGKKIDRKRFVELLKDFAPATLVATQVSVPMLVWQLRQSGHVTESQNVRAAWLNFSQTRVLTGKDVDQAESEILSLCGTISVKDIRECSYANLLYREIRSGYAHEYRPGNRADSWPMTQDLTAAVSYINRLGDLDRLVHFHVEWVAKLAVAIAQAIDREAASVPRIAPKKWWLEG